MKQPPITEQTKGVFIIAPTPFSSSGDLDLDSIDTLVDFYLDRGVDGITILGILGEATKLTGEEAHEVMLRYIRRVAGRVPIIVGASNPGTTSLVNFSRHAMEAGAAGVMIAPIPGLKTDEQVFNYTAQVLERLGPDVPVCYQDYPQTTTVNTSVAVLSRLIADFKNLVMLKHEEWPGLAKITRLRTAEKANGARRISILVGNNGVHLPQELERGVDGAMTGFSYPEMLVDVCRMFFAGDSTGAEDVFDMYLPLLRHEYQPGFGLAIRKEVLRRRGAMKTSTLRHPGASLNEVDHRELDRLIARLERNLANAGSSMEKRIAHG
jgi:4-hydroxy-tetrahydrodipicolinate synthase